MDLASLVIAAVAVLVGAAGQRMIGMGWGLIVTPVVALVAGPLAAVLVVNVYGAIACLMILPSVWREVDWRRLLWLAVPAIVLMVPGLLLAQALDTDLLRVIVGGIAIGGVIVSIAVTRTSHRLDGPGVRLAAGSTIGLLNASVGMGAPIVGLYSLLSHWHDKTFVATMQPFWALVSGIIVAVRPFVAPEGAPDWPLWGWIALVAPVAAGVFLGDRMAHRVNRSVVRWSIIVCSLLGGLSLVIAGTAALLA